MCGIVGVIAKNELGKEWAKYIPAATAALKQRGPDAQNYFSGDDAELGHCRLTIIDLSESANQPMHDDELVTIYNGEIFNFKEIRKKLEEDRVPFKTQSDTEVLLKLYKMYGEKMLDHLNGFFAFAIYDKKNKSCFVARDRFGVKPLFYFENENCFLFASELKSLLQFPIPREIDHESLYEYLQLNYIPAPNTIFRNVKKLLPGHFLHFQNGTVECKRYYLLDESSEKQIAVTNYSEAKNRLFELLNDAVRLRLISDVPLGAFLSGGIDSSIVCGLASRHTQHLKTFSIGYREHEFFDETKYARLVSKHFNTEHTVFSLTRSDLHESLFEVLNYFDEPFGDSSALPVYILSQHTRKHVKVSLSGDGADELFGGYLKHLAEFRARNQQLPELSAAFLSPLWKLIPKSRNSSLSNLARKAQRYSDGIKLNLHDRYWKWCSVADEEQVTALLQLHHEETQYAQRKNYLTRYIGSKKDLNDVLLNDVSMVLPDDMLSKIDYMSMAASLEVRTPFLDYRVAEFAFSIPASFKIDRRHRKKIVHDAFRDFLPPELRNRRKQGFEIPLHSFLTRELKPILHNYVSDSFILEQKIFDLSAIRNLLEQLYSSNPNDSAARMWGLLVFQHWWKQWMS